ncbi:MAG: hypothetical protein ACR2GD_04875 [Pyrinomonadaceae bacterium]
MGKVAILILGLVLGLLIGAGGVLYFVSPRRAAPVGKPIQPPDASGQPAGTAVVELKQDFFTPVIGAILSNGNAPAFPLNLTGQTSQPVNEITCGKITLQPEDNGTTTAVKLENGQILVPIAFAGNFNALGSCVEFKGWAQANLELRYDETQQIVFGQINVQTVNLDGISPIVSGLVTPIVQSTLNNRVNPVQILRGDQIALKVPIKSTGSILKAQVKDIRAEVKDNALSLYVTYNFSGAPENAPTQ